MFPLLLCRKFSLTFSSNPCLSQKEIVTLRRKSEVKLKETRLMKYLDPKADLTFKKIFGNHPKRLISLLNALLPLSADERIHEIEYLPTELVPELEGHKNTIVDVLCKDAKGRKFCVEMQMEWSNAFKQRVLFNASKLYVSQAMKKENYSDLQPVYSLNLVNDIFERDTDEFARQGQREGNQGLAFHLHRAAQVHASFRSRQAHDGVVAPLPDGNQRQPRDR